MPRTAALLALALAVLAGCGGETDRPNTRATLVLQGPPSAADVGIYVATSRGYDEAEGVQLAVRAATTPHTGSRRLRSGSAQFAVMDIHALALARERGRDLVAVMAITQLPDERDARAALRAHGRFATARALDLRRAPVYPERVLVVTRMTYDEQPATVRAAVTALVRGYREELSDPETALGLQLERVAPSRAAGLRAELPKVEASFTGPSGQVGTLDRAALVRWARWATQVGITRRPTDVDAAFPGVSRR